MKILTVEDNMVAAAVLDAALLKLGHEPCRASDGLTAWRAFETDPGRGGVSDWLMPGLDGAVEAGGNDFLHKPVKLDELKMRLHVAERILNYSTQVQQLESFIPLCS